MSDHIPREFIEILLAKIDLVDLIHTHVPLHKKSGSNYFARCPFHQEKSASFSVSQPKQFYYCFGCGAHGNAIDFMMHFERLSFPEAIETLARHAGMEISYTSNTQKDDSFSQLYTLMNKAADFYYDQMRHSKPAITYLKKRGIAGTLARQFHLGFAPNGWSSVLDAFGKTERDKKQLSESGLIIKKSEGNYYDRFRDRIMFPIRDVRGRVIGFGGRIIDQGEPKYLNSPETILFQKGHELYGLYEALKSHRKLERIMIVEGYMDVIALFQHGITYAVATMGTATTTHHLQRLFRYTSALIFCFDGDEAGRRAAWRALQALFPLMHDSLQIHFLFLPEGEDPDTLVRKEGQAGFEKRMESALSLSAFFFQRLLQQSDLNSMEGRARLAALALNDIKQLPNGLFQGLMLAELSKRTRIDINELRQQLKQQEPIAAKQPLTEQAHKVKVPPIIRLAAGLLLQHPDLAALITEPLPEQLALTGYSFLLQLIEIIQKSPNITTGGIIEKYREEKEGAWLAKLAYWEHMIPEKGIKEAFLGAIHHLLTLGFDAEINRLLTKAGFEALAENEKIALSTWIAKKKNLIMATN